MGEKEKKKKKSSRGIIITWSKWLDTSNWGWQLKEFSEVSTYLFLQEKTIDIIN